MLQRAQTDRRDAGDNRRVNSGDRDDATGDLLNLRGKVETAGRHRIVAVRQDRVAHGRPVLVSVEKRVRVVDLIG